MKLDATYTLTAGTDNEEITLTDIITTAGTRSVKTMSDPKGGKMSNNSDNKGTPPSKPSDTAGVNRYSSFSTGTFAVPVRKKVILPWLSSYFQFTVFCAKITSQEKR